MKASTVILAAALLVQGVTAGQVLSNEDGSQLHQATGPIVTVAMVLQIIAALLVWRAGHGSARYLAVSALLFVLVSVQFVVGGNGNLAVHVPLGVALFGASAVLVAQAWSTRPAD
jgi:cytochrome b